MVKPFKTPRVGFATLHPALYRASGYDFANLWMNMAKLVIALVFLYQNALGTQLGVRLFQDNFYVFHVSVNPDSSRPGSDSAEVVTPEDPYFSIDFKPLALGQAYRDFTVEVLELENAEGKSLLKPTSPETGPCDPALPSCVRFTWDELTQGDKAVLHQASFNLLDLVAEESALVSGDYKVKFGFKFFKDGRQLGRRLSKTYDGTLKFLRKEELRFGDVPVVQGRPFGMPRLILDRLSKGGRWGGWDAYREVRVMEGGANAPWRDGSLLEADFQRGWLRPASRLAAGKTYEQRGHYLDVNNLQVDFTIGFNLLRNEPPRSTYRGPGDSDIYFVRIFYEWHFFQEAQGYYYYNLSRHIIDPDGTTDPIDGRPEVRVRDFADLEPANLPYRLVKDRASGDWHLRVEGKIEESLRPGNHHDLTLLARDDFQSQRMKIRIER